jgi:hypothetical protein
MNYLKRFNDCFYGFLSKLPYWYMCWVLSGIFLLAITSIINLKGDIFFQFIHVLSFITTLFLFKNFSTTFEISSKKRGWILVLLFIFIIPTLIRFPLYFPLYDDLSFHIPVGTYAGNYWFDKNYMPMGILNYLYPLAQLVYQPFIDFFGLRLTLLITSFSMTVWFYSLTLRFTDLNQFKKINKYFLLGAFIYMFFYPYLMTTQVSFSVDFIALLFALEAFYQFISLKIKNKTLSLFLFFISFFLKESTGIFLLPLTIFVFFSVWSKKINWKLIIILLGFVSIYFIRCFFETGNPLFFLYNGIFKSPIFPIGNFRDPIFGALNIKQVLLWPFIGPFTERFGQGWVPQYLKIFYVLFLPFPLVLSLLIIFLKKKWMFFIIPVTYYLWAYMSGYSRYLIPFTSIFLIWVIMEIKIPNFYVKNIFIKICFIIISVIFVFFCLTSIQTDYGWRRYPLFKIFGRKARTFTSFVEGYKAGLKLIGKDKPKIMAEKYSDQFSGYEAVIPLRRGQATFYSYLGYLNGLDVIEAVSNDIYKNVSNSAKISQRLKNNLKNINNSEKILFVYAIQLESIAKDTYVYSHFACKKLGKGVGITEFQSDYINRIVRLSCIKK